MRNLQSLLGIFILLALAWSMSEHRRAVAWKETGIALLATVGLAILMLKIPGAAGVFAGAKQSPRRRGPAHHSCLAILVEASFPMS
jgi:nucleoside permease NupC